jgi:hypothetical protein
MSEKVERLEAELKLAKLEDKFVKAKEAGKVTQKMKLDMREARRDFRSKYRPQVNVNPATIGTKATVKGTGS